LCAKLSAGWTGVRKSDRTRFVDSGARQRWPERIAARSRLRRSETIEAQLALKRDKRWSSPYYWAGFVLEGDWR